VDAPAIAFAATPHGKVAFQQVGNAATPLVLVPPLAQNIEMLWEQPVFWRPIMRVASAFRYVQYDKLGTGLSDPVPASASLDDRLEELTAVLDAARVKRGWLLGVSEGAVIALAAAARIPDRVLGVVVISGYSGNGALAEAASYGPVPERSAWRAFFEDVVARWGSEGSATLRDFAPSLRAIPAMAKWLPRYERAAASPAMIGSLLTSGFGLDVTALLPKIAKPTLVIHIAGDRVVPAAFGRMLGKRIAGARYVELEGNDHFSWVSPSVDEQIDLLFEFTKVRGRGARVHTVWDPASVLTPSEQRTVRLAQRGLANAEIAAQLEVSLRTVENHLSRAYGKLGVRSRTELALLSSI